MTTKYETSNIKRAFERTARALQLRPRRGQITPTTVVRLRAGEVACDVEDGGYHILVDLTPDNGGRGAGPDPGILIRGGLGACLAGGYQMWASHMDIVLDEVEVIIEADMDARGMFGVDDSVPPGYQAVRANVRIVSSSPEERVREMVEAADRHSPLLYDFTTPLPVTVNVDIKQPGEA